MQVPPSRRHPAIAPPARPPPTSTSATFGPRSSNNGNLFYGPVDGGSVQAAYVVPKNSGNTAIFAANLWVGGMVGDELRVAAATFLDFDLWPGPLEDGATLPDPDDCSDWDRIWVVSTLDVQAYDDTCIATADLAEWPVDLGAEVVDGDGVSGNYNLAGGDRPRIYGSQTAFWVMNDVGNEHVRSESEPVGLEVQAAAFAISSPSTPPSIRRPSTASTSSTETRFHRRRARPPSSTISNSATQVTTT